MNAGEWRILLQYLRAGDVENKVTVSIVSHGHCDMLHELFRQLHCNANGIAHVILTHNIPSDFSFDDFDFSFEISIIRNDHPIGFGANHNQAFELCETEYFCVLNPDIEIFKDPFLDLVQSLVSESAGIIAPMVINGVGGGEDSYRKFPTPFSIFKKFIFGDRELYEFSLNSMVFYPDWVAGMFMLIDSGVYRDLKGFDEAYFLYYEDVDLCLRAWRSGHKVSVLRSVSVVHHARRESHVKLLFLAAHLKSMLRFFSKHWFRFPR